METITLATFEETWQAEPLRRLLEEAHISAEIREESVMEHFWFVKRPRAGVKLRVREEDYEAASRLAHVWDQTQGVLRYAVVCPECGCSRVEYPQMTRKFIVPNLIGFLSALGIIERKFYCRSCQHTWAPSSHHHRARHHMAPYYFLDDVPTEETHGSEASEPVKSAV